MKIKTLLSVTALAGALVGCGGDVNISPSTSVSNSNNTSTTTTGGGSTAADQFCGSYTTDAGEEKSGVFLDGNCWYTEDFVSTGNNLMYDLTLPSIPSNGAHVFEGSLFVGQDHASNAELTAAGITQGGDGPTLTIEAGATLAFQSNADFMLINRGSQIVAVGTQSEPITFTSVSDIEGNVGPEDVQQWGGVVINGFGVTNECTYSGSLINGDLAVVGECHVQAEGSKDQQVSNYGGDNNADSSGHLEYVRVKHTGAEVAPGKELNGISFGGVGSGTTVRNLQVYSTYDDGIEMFGGAVSFENFVAVYVRDDAIDIDQGWSGSITNALVIQSATDGNHCIEADGIGPYGDISEAARESIIDAGINSRATITNLTCIISPNSEAVVTHDPGAGWRFREGLFMNISNSMVIGSFSANATDRSDDNYCLRIDNRSQQAALDGDITIDNVIFACAELTKGQTFSDGTTTEQSFAEASGSVFATIPGGTAVSATAVSDAGLQLLEGSLPIYSIDFDTSLVDGATPAASADPTPATFLGALSQGEEDWTADWTYGIHPDSRAQPLWFESL